MAAMAALITTFTAWNEKNGCKKRADDQVAGEYLRNAYYIPTSNVLIRNLVPFSSTPYDNRPSVVSPPRVQNPRPSTCPKHDL